jgi:cytoskeletal protein CcmA (bactofilin family)
MAPTIVFLKGKHMAIAQNFFNKREPVIPPQRPTTPTPNANGQLAASNASTRQVQPGAPIQSSQAGAAPTPVTANTPAPTEGGSKLTVGPNIKLKGVEITDCDTMVVEGMVEATMDSRVMQISEQGAFKGSAEIDIAEIHGHFEGTLTVRQKLIIYATGKVTGKVSYNKLVIEEGGQLTGDIQFGAVNSPRIGGPEKLGLSVVG